MGTVRRTILVTWLEPGTAVTGPCGSLEVKLPVLVEVIACFGANGHLHDILGLHLSQDTHEGRRV